MLHLDDRPPDFTLPDRADGGQFALADLLGSTRILMVLAPSNIGAQCAAVLLDEAVTRKDELADRDLHMVAIIAPEVWLSPPLEIETIHVLMDASGQTAKQYDGDAEHASFYLIGKDGQIKMASSEAPTLNDVFQLIDDMPMRRREMAASGANV